MWKAQIPVKPTKPIDGPAPGKHFRLFSRCCQTGTEHSTVSYIFRHVIHQSINHLLRNVKIFSLIINIARPIHHHDPFPTSCMGSLNVVRSGVTHKMYSCDCNKVVFWILILSFVTKCTTMQYNWRSYLYGLWLALFRLSSFTVCRISYYNK